MHRPWPTVVNNCLTTSRNAKFEVTDHTNLQIVAIAIGAVLVNFFDSSFANTLYETE